MLGVGNEGLVDTRLGGVPSVCDCFIDIAAAVVSYATNQHGMCNLLSLYFCLICAINKGSCANLVDLYLAFLVVLGL